MKSALRILMILAFLALMVSVQIIPVLRPWNASNPYSAIITLSCFEVLSILEPFLGAGLGNPVAVV